MCRTSPTTRSIEAVSNGACGVLSILIPHVTMAALLLPLAIITLRRGLRRDDKRHRRIARRTLPVWLFVSVTGVVVYLMLYQLF